jgi:hypothetical protein
VAQAREHSANLTILALGQDDLQPSTLALRLEPANSFGLDASLGKPNPFQEFLDILFAGLASDENEIGLVDAKSRVHELVG